MTKSASIPVTQKLSVMRSLPYDVIYPKYYKHSNESGTFVTNQDVLLLATIRYIIAPKLP